MQIFNYRFQPKLIPTFATLLLLPLLLNLGLWQANKADKKQAMQDIYDQRGQSALVQIGAEPLNLESIRFSRVVARGYFEPAYQILLDTRFIKARRDIMSSPRCILLEVRFAFWSTVAGFHLVLTGIICP